MKSFSVEKKKLKMGFTMLELVIASGVLLVAVVGMLAFYQSPFALNETARDTTIAVDDAVGVLEAMRTTAFDNIQTTNWDTWAQNNRAKNLAGTGESVSVTYSGTNPLRAMVEVRWTRRGREKFVRLTTQFAQLVSTVTSGSGGGGGDGGGIEKGGGGLGF